MAASSAFHRTLESISKFKGENYRKWRDKLREAIALYSDDMVDLRYSVFTRYGCQRECRWSDRLEHVKQKAL